MRILLVDDAQAVADSLAELLTENGFEVFVAYDGESAIHTAIDRNPELLISDVCMEGMNGVEVAIRIRAMIPECKVILCSGQPDLLDSFHQFRLDEYPFEILHKPVPAQQLLQRIHVLAGSADGRTTPVAQAVPEDTKIASECRNARILREITLIAKRFEQDSRSKAAIHRKRWKRLGAIVEQALKSTEGAGRRSPATGKPAKSSRRHDLQQEMSEINNESGTSLSGVVLRMQSGAPE